MSGLRPCSAPAPGGRRGRRRCWPSCPSRPGRCSSTSWPPVARPPPTTRGTRCCPRTRPRRPRSCSPAGCWCRAGPATVVVPGEVGLALRGGHTTVERVDDVPALATTERSERRSTRVAAGAAFEAVRRLELLLDLWGADPPSALRSGGLGVRDLKATAAALHVDEATMALLVETASASGLLATAADGVGNPVWLPTDLVDTLGAAAARRAVGRAGPDLAGQPADAGAGRVPRHRRQAVERAGARAGRRAHGRDPRDDAGGAGGVARRRVPGRRDRRAVRGRAAALAAAAPAAEPRRPGALDGHRGRRARGHRARRPGVVRPGPAGRRGRQGDTRRWPGCCPSRSTTCCCRPTSPRSRPGRWSRSWPGGCSSSPTWSRAVGRPSTASPPARSAAPSTPAGPRSSCTSSSGRCRGRPVPQPLTYLVDDTARTFGSVRVGHAEAFLRADDETALTELLHHPKASALALRRLAPTVLVSTDAARPPAAPAARARRRAGRRGRGRHRARRPPRPAPGPDPARAPRARGRLGPAYGHRLRRRHRDPLRRPGRVVPPDGARGRALRRPGRSPRCARRSRPARRC